MKVRSMIRRHLSVGTESLVVRCSADEIGSHRQTSPMVYVTEYWHDCCPVLDLSLCKEFISRKL
jgi:hypothetical protein